MQTTSRGVIPQIAERSGAFAGSFLTVFALSFVFLWAVGATPDPTTVTAEVKEDAKPAAAAIVAASTVTTTPENPVRIVVKAISLDVTIKNPTSTDIDTLDNALLTGAARYPTSAKLGEVGTVLLFGHSSYLPVVHNQAYRAFDGIQNLKTGEVISVYSGTTEYRYSVVGVKLADATQDTIELTSTGKHLTLVTCDSFSKKTNRFVVTADFVGAYSLGN